MVKLTTEERLERHREACRRYRREHQDAVRGAGRKYSKEHPGIYKKASKKYHDANREKMAAKCLERYYASRDERKVAQQEWRRKDPDKHVAQTRRWVMPHHDERLAQIHAQRKVDLDGDCEVCGKPAVLRHHHDYTKPLDVQLLCAQCHSDIHRHKFLPLGRPPKPEAPTEGKPDVV